MINHYGVILLMLGLLVVQTVAATNAAPAQNEVRCFLLENGRASFDANSPPEGTWDSGFGGHLTGWDNRQIMIGVRAEPGKKYVFVPGFYETHWSSPGKRIVSVTIEGQHKGDIDVVQKEGAVSPCGAQYVAEDLNGDGWIRFEISAAPKAEDKNCILNVLWVFETSDGKPVDLAAVMAGKLNDKVYVRADGRSLKPEVDKRIESIGDGRLCTGNGYWLASFVGPMEEPEEPVYKVHDKISRLWLGYSSPQIANIGMAPRIKDLRSGKEWVVGPCDNYRYDDGVIVMETKIDPGTVRTETYGLWDKPVMIRKISFIPNAGSSGDFQISTDVSLYKGSIKKKTPEQLRLDWNAYAEDERERPPVLSFPQREEIKISKTASSAEWTYESPHHRKVAIGAGEANTQIEIVESSRKTHATFEGDKSGTLRFVRKCDSKGGVLTVVLAFDKQLDKAKQLLAESRDKAASPAEVQASWRKWFENGAVIRTGNKKLDDAYRVQAMCWKLAQDAELGGIVVGARYQIAVVWARDGGVAISSMLDAGHYQEAKNALRFFSKYAYWNARNNCINANSHTSGRVMSFMCGPGQPPVEDIVQPGEWTNQMLGPQLDGMGYYLYNIGKYYRCTGDKEFIREEWPFIMKVADSLAADDYCVSESGPQGEYTDKHLRFKKYNAETGLIVDNCCEDGTFREMMITSALASAGFRQAYILSELMGEAVPLWTQRADELDAAIKKQCYRKDDKGEYFVERPPRPWLNNGAESHIGGCGFPWMIAATVPYYNYTDQIFRDTYRRFVEPDGKIGGWGMWYATTAHAAFEADLADVGWNYLRQVVEELPESLQLYEHNQDVTGADGVTRRVTYNLFGYSYLPHAMIRGFAGLGYNEKTKQYYLRPQIPDELGTVQSHIKVGNASFDVTASGNGDKFVEFKIDGIDQPLTGILDTKYLDGGKHVIVIRMGK